MDSPSSRNPLDVLPAPLTEGAVRSTMLGLRRALAQQPGETTTAWQSRLMGYLSQQNAALEAQARETVAGLLRLSDSTSALDRLVPRSIPPETLPSGPSPDRGQPASPLSRPPSPLDLLSASSRMGPRLAAKLALADARSAARKR